MNTPSEEAVISVKRLLLRKLRAWPRVLPLWKGMTPTGMSIHPKDLWRLRQKPGFIVEVVRDQSVPYTLIVGAHECAGCYGSTVPVWEDSECKRGYANVRYLDEHPDRRESAYRLLKL